MLLVLCTWQPIPISVQVEEYLILPLKCLGITLSSNLSYGPTTSPLHARQLNGKLDSSIDSSTRPHPNSDSKSTILPKLEYRLGPASQKGRRQPGQCTDVCWKDDYQKLVYELIWAPIQTKRTGNLSNLVGGTYIQHSQQLFTYTPFFKPSLPFPQALSQQNPFQTPCFYPISSSLILYRRHPSLKLTNCRQPLTQCF